MRPRKPETHPRPLNRPDAVERRPAARPARAAAILIRAAQRAGLSSARAVASAARTLVQWARLTGQDPGKAARGAVRGAAAVEPELDISRTQAASAAALGALQAARTVAPGRAAHVKRAVMGEYVAACREEGQPPVGPVVDHRSAQPDADPDATPGSEPERPRRGPRKLALALLRGARGGGLGVRAAIRATSRAMIKQAAHDGDDVPRTAEAVLDATAEFARETGMSPREAVGMAARSARNSAGELGSHAATSVREAAGNYLRESHAVS